MLDLAALIFVLSGVALVNDPPTSVYIIFFISGAACLWYATKE